MLPAVVVANLRWERNEEGKAMDIWEEGAGLVLRCEIRLISGALGRGFVPALRRRRTVRVQA